MSMHCGNGAGNQTHIHMHAIPVHSRLLCCLWALSEFAHCKGKTEKFVYGIYGRLQLTAVRASRHTSVATAIALQEVVNGLARRNASACAQVVGGSNAVSPLLLFCESTIRVGYQTSAARHGGISQHSGMPLHVTQQSVEPSAMEICRILQTSLECNNVYQQVQLR